MARFVKTQVHVVSAVLFLVALYAMAGLAYSAWTRSADAAVTWAVVAGVALVASFGYQRIVAKKRRAAP